MEPFAHQSAYWDKAATTKVFGHPLDHDRFAHEVDVKAAILDYGCGQGRLCGELAQRGFGNIAGVDYSRDMIDMARAAMPTVTFSVVDGSALPHVDASLDVVLLFAVLTCIPVDDAQRELVAEITRALKPGALLVISDYPLQQDERNLRRYAAFAEALGGYGTFRLPDGGVVRHHHRDWYSTLLAGYSITHETEFEARTMNGNSARILQLWARKR